MRNGFVIATFICMAAVGGCQGALLGNMVVMGLTVGIFVGTLSLGRHAKPQSAAPSETAATSNTTSNTTVSR